MNDAILEHTITNLLAEIQEKKGAGVWVLLDPTFCAAGTDALTNQWIALAHQCHQPSIPGYEMTSRNCPLWLGADLETESGRALIEQTLEHALRELLPSQLIGGLGRRVCAWVLARDGAVAASRMSRMLVQSRGDGHRALLRFYDPAVLWALWSSLSLPQRQAWMASADAWWLLKPNAELMALHTQLDAARRIEFDDAHADRKGWTTLRLQPSQWRAIDVMSSFNAAMREWLMQVEDAELTGRGRYAAMSTADFRLEERRDRALGAIEAARQQGIHDADALISRALESFELAA